MNESMKSSFVLLIVSLYETQELNLFAPPHTIILVPQRHGPMMLRVHTLTTWGQYCHIESESVALVWSRLR